ncbi:hypothetical protein EC915_106170 [Pseudomonas sp. LP_7_YM]|nr:hypothetical protein EC915_106170 [Pseudomonas sp. LP_7_YM]
MASVLVGQFQARDAEGRVYQVHEFRESQPEATHSPTQVSTYRLAIGDRMNHLGGDDFELLQSGTKLKREPQGGQAPLVQSPESSPNTDVSDA